MSARVRRAALVAGLVMFGILVGFVGVVSGLLGFLFGALAIALDVVSELPRVLLSWCIRLATEVLDWGRARILAVVQNAQQPGVQT